MVLAWILFIAVKGYKVAIIYLYYHKIRINIVIIIYIVRKNTLFYNNFKKSIEKNCTLGYSFSIKVRIYKNYIYIIILK